MNSKFDEENILEQLKHPTTHRSAFEKIVQQFSPQLYWQIRRMVFSHDDANDLLQETLIAAWKNIDYFRGESSLATWLYRIAMNQCLNFLNKRNAGKTVSLDDEGENVMNMLESDPYFNGDRVQLLLQKALASLPPKQRMVFNFRYYEDMTFTDMSLFLGTSVGALKADYHHAVKKIKKFFEDND